MKYEIELTEKEVEILEESAKKIDILPKDLCLSIIREYTRKLVVPENADNFVTIIENFIPDEICDYFVEIVKSAKEEKKLSEWGQTLVYSNKENNSDVTDFTRNHVKEFMDLVRKTYSWDKPLYKEQAYFFLWPIGADHQAHFDNNFLAFEQMGVKPELHPDSPEIIFSSILYLNDGWEGGELYFPRLNKIISPKKGDFIFFPSDSIIAEHGVKEVRTAERITFASWLQRENK